MAKVLLIQAAIHDEHIERGHPLGLMSLASYLRSTRGDEVRIYDMRLDWRRFDLPLAAFDSFMPDVVGISAHGVDAPAMHKLAAGIKKRSQRTPVVCGGIHATSYWREVLQKPYIDTIVISEGEISFRQWMDAIEKQASPEKIQGIAYKENGCIQKTADQPMENELDRFGFPSWDLIDIDAYGRFPRTGIYYKDKRYMSIETARGCPFHCVWCHRTMGDQFRPHSSEYVIAMIDKLIQDHRVSDFLIIDDMFNLDSERMDRIFQTIIDKGLKVGFSMLNGVRADMLSDETLERMKKAGVYKLMVAVEVSSPRLQKKMKKNLDVDKTLQVIHKASQLGISTHGNFMIGLPSETEKEMWHTFHTAIHSRLDTFGLYRAIPFKGTQLYEIAKQENPDKFQGEESLSFWDLDVNLSSIPLRKLNFVRRIAYPRFYLRPGRLWRILTHMPHRIRLVPFLFCFFLKKLFSK